MTSSRSQRIHELAFGLWETLAQMELTQVRDKQTKEIIKGKHFSGYCLFLFDKTKDKKIMKTQRKINKKKTQNKKENN